MGFFKKLKDRLFTLDIEGITQEHSKEKSANAPKKIEKVPKKQDKPKKTKSNLEDKLKKKEIKQRVKQGKLKKYVAGMSKSGTSFTQAIKDIQNSHKKIDDNLFESLEDVLIMNDVSHTLVTNIIEEVKREVRNEGIEDTKLIGEILSDKIFAIYTNQEIINTTLNIEEDRKNIFIVVGVNGSGKTTSIAKLAKHLTDEGQKVLIAAADTFRAGAVAQLAVWAKRVGVDIVTPAKDHADPSSVVFDAMDKHENGDYDVLIIDTAGRLQNKVNLMKELEKMKKIIQRKNADAPHESLLVLDATTGQNGISQAKNFKEICDLSGIILTKMDGTSKGGIVLTIKEETGLAVKFIGLGEQLDDLQEFDLDSFIYGFTKGLME